MARRSLSVIHTYFRDLLQRAALPFLVILSFPENSRLAACPVQSALFAPKPSLIINLLNVVK